MSELLPPACVDPDRFLVELAFDETISVPQEIQAHIAGCERCSRALKELKEARAAAALPLESPSVQMDMGVLAALDAHLKGEKVDSFIKLPEPERALGAERLVRHLSQPPRPRTEPTPQVEEAPKILRPARSRRRWMGALAAAASVAVVAGGAYLLNEDGHVSPASRLEEPVADATAEKAAAAPAAPVVAATAEGKKDQPAPPPEAASKGASPNFADAVATRDTKAEEPKKKVARLSSSSGLASLGARDTRGGLGMGAGGAAGDIVELRPSSGAGNTVAVPMPQAPAPAPPAMVAPAAPMAPPPAATAMKEEAPAPPTATADLSDADELRAVPRREKKTMKALAKDDATGTAELDRPSWSAPLEAARAAARRGNHSGAAASYAQVLACTDLPPAVDQEALKGRLDALLALRRFDDAQAVADQLAARYPAQVSAKERVQRAKAAAGAPVEAGLPAAAPAAEAMPASAADKK